MTAKLNLRADEWVVLKGEQGARYRDPADYVMGNLRKPTLSPEELVLTSHHIISVTSDLFGRVKESRYFPLDRIKVGDRPQVFAERKNALNLLEVYFVDGQETFQFTTEKELNLWVAALHDLLTGGTGQVSAPNGRALPGTAQVAGIMKDTVDVFKTSFGMKSAPAPAPTAPQRVAGNCSACGASISGFASRVVECTYCGSHQQLSTGGAAPAAPPAAPAQAQRAAQVQPAAQARPAQPRTAPGWYPDPSDRPFRQRYFDGSGWTQHVVDHSGRQVVDPYPIGTL